MMMNAMTKAWMAITITSTTLPGCATDAPEDLGTSSTAQALDASAYGFAWVPLGVGSPPASWAANTGGGPITVLPLATGQYRVTFGGLGGPSGNAQVVAHGTDNTRCKVQSWFQSGADELVNVQCNTPAGAAINSSFVVRYGRATNSLPAAYLWADQPSNPSYAPTSLYSYNSTGGTNTVQRSAVGTYTVNLPGLGGANGSVMVTAHGSSSTHCNLVSWGSAPGNRPIQVRCWDSTGALADSTFSLAYEWDEVTGFNSVGASAWANDISSSMYSPSASYSYNSGLFVCSRGNNTAGRSSLGRYFMRHTGIPAEDSTVHVTARNGFGAPDYCKIESWVATGTGQQVEVTTRCFDGNGAPKDAEYDESYYTTAFVGPC